MAVVFFRQVQTLVAKNLRVVLIRHPFATFIRTLLIPIILFVFFSYAKYIFVPAAVYGIGTSRPLLSLSDALAIAASTGRHKVAFYNGGLSGGAIDAVIDALVPVVEAAGSKVVRLTDDNQLDTICHSSLRGVTSCYGAVLFASSPSEGDAGIWKYTIRLDGALGAGKINIDKSDNDGEVYALPLQHALDSAIVAQQNGNSSGANAIADAAVHEYPFTSLTSEQRREEIRINYQSAITRFLGVGFISGVIGICYHLAGFMATERETGMSTLIDAMMTTSASGSRWGEAQIARLVSYHVSFTMLYLPGWVIGSAVVAASVFSNTSAAIVILYHVLAGIALASMAMFGAAFFRHSQLSGVSVTLIYLILAIVSQTISSPQSGTVIVLCLLFAPCNYVFFMTEIARFERHREAANLLHVPPGSPWQVSGIVLWVFLIIQLFGYFLLAIYVDRYLHGTTTTGRTITVRSPDSDVDTGSTPALRLESFSKTYSPGPLRRAFGWAKKLPEPVHAVRELTLSAGRGQILVLLGSNGSGKSTTLDAIAGTSKLTSGRISIDGTGGLGIAPQKNVMWDDLTVEEHIRVFNRLKSPFSLASREETRQLVASVDLEMKTKALAKTLSGGQQRKLQLGMMLTGGSAVCCVDEVSSGLDPLSRRKIWDILLAERGRRTIIMTTHFLDEADLLSDHIAVLSKGALRAEGSSAALKERLGGGYRIHVPKTRTSKNTVVPVNSSFDLPDVDGVVKESAFDTISYIAPSSSLAARVIRVLEAAGVADYRFSGPTLEDVFLKLVEEVQSEEKLEADELDSTVTVSEKHLSSDKDGAVTSSEVLVRSDDGTDASSNEGRGLKLMSGRRIGYWQQARVLFMKRVTVLKSSWLPSLAAFAIPVIAAGLVMLFVMNQGPIGCSSADQLSNDQPETLAESGYSVVLVAGPRAQFTDTTALLQLFTPLFSSNSSSSRSSNSSTDTSVVASLLRNVTLADNFTHFNQLIMKKRRSIGPAGLWLGDDSSPPTLAYRANSQDQVSSLYGQNILDALLANTSISVSYTSFAIPWSPDTGKTLQLLVYVSLACAAYVGFFSLYPNLERRRNVRGLQYSNGVSALPLWMAYVSFDLGIVLLSSALVAILFAALSSIWYHVGYMFIIFTLYGLASAPLAYFVSLFCSSQLSAYAFTAAIQAVIFLVYMIAYLCTITYAPVNHIDSYLLVVHFVVSAVSPIGSLVRALFVSLNLFSVSCSGKELSQHPGSITLYGGPILYLFVQAFVYFGLVLWFDSGDVGATLHQMAIRVKRHKARRREAADVEEEEGQEEEASKKEGLQVTHVTKTFKNNTAVDNVSFSVGHGEVFALLGPNGAGKSTTISMIRGDIKPDDGDVFVEGASVQRQLGAARGGLGVCPQFDAVDQMTVREHLRFYAQVRGITDVAHNVQAVMQAVGLAALGDRQAQALSGGNKRKLSLGIALMGNPAVVLLDEPSSGLDAAAKRIMWRTLAATSPGRSILLTTHSMEEADALAGRAGILARRMLAAGVTEELRSRFGSRLYVHVVCRGAPHTPEAETERLRRWAAAVFPGAEVEEQTYHGQMRFAIPVVNGQLVEDDTATEKPVRATSAVGRLVVLLDEQREALGIDHFSVSPTTLDQVFLTIVGRHNVQEEGYRQEELAAVKRKWWKLGLRD
ncbi:ABC transporter [Grosmannia clavigera kw1407]|uniref:ABC transporter n=1 Tax=Grosmannia clavigera (strain kw1407 / UAMH 11150) TaxID=655863 RepID=F0X9M1_GROCL|nr:ABC transporter [Grosmannia clavigera kw1407]EFX05787.1 ABC transporter [Grosmannia clavigera kw1407]